MTTPYRWPADMLWIVSRYRKRSGPVAVYTDQREAREALARIERANPESHWRLSGHTLNDRRDDPPDHTVVEVAAVREAVRLLEHARLMLGVLVEDFGKDGKDTDDQLAAVIGRLADALPPAESPT